MGTGQVIWCLQHLIQKFYIRSHIYNTNNTYTAIVHMHLYMTCYNCYNTDKNFPNTLSSYYKQLEKILLSACK